MSLAGFIEHFEEAVEDIESGSLEGATVYRDLKTWDSLAVLTLTDTVDMEYGVLLTKADYAASATIEDLYRRVLDKSERSL